MKLIAVLCLLSLPAWGEDPPRAVPVEGARLLLRGGGFEEVGAGYYLNASAGEKRAKELVQLRAENETLRAEAGQVEARLLIAVLVAGLVGGALIYRVVRP